MTKTGAPAPEFEEVQYPPWPLLALGVGAGAAAILVGAGRLGPLARLGAAAVTAGGTGLVFRELLFPMTTTVPDGKIEVLFGRRLRFEIPLQDVFRAYPRSYEPIWEYGGWGIRLGAGGGAYNMRGNEGVQLHLRDGRRLLIGSQRAEELAEVIRRLSGAGV